MSDSERTNIFGAIEFGPARPAAPPAREHRFGPKRTPLMGDAPEATLEAATAWASSGEASEVELERIERQTRAHRSRSDYFQVSLALAKMPRIAETQRLLHQEILPEMFRARRLENMNTRELSFLLQTVAKIHELDLKFVVDSARRGPQDLPGLVQKESGAQAGRLSNAAERFGSLQPRERERLRQTLGLVIPGLLQAASPGANGGNGGSNGAGHDDPHEE